MTAFKNATAFFHACESLKGLDGCQAFLADGATFNAQSEGLTDISTASDYVNWMQGVGTGPLNGCHYELNAASYDEKSRTAIFFGTFFGTHTGAGGPVEPTQKSTETHYVFVLEMDKSNKVSKVTKIWNSNWAFAELGWA